MHPDVVAMSAKSKGQGICVLWTCLVLILFQKIGFGFLCKLSAQEIICMKCQSPFSGKNVMNLSSDEVTQRVVNIKQLHFKLIHVALSNNCWMNGNQCIP